MLIIKYNNTYNTITTNIKSQNTANTSAAY